MATQLHDLKPQSGSKKNRKRVGRGLAAGQGKTAGRGVKGQGSRSGGSTRLYHQGGNLPFFRRLPFVRGKGFTPLNSIEYYEINLDQLNSFKEGSTVDPKALGKASLLRDDESRVVILGRGEVKVALHVKTHRISEGAKAKIEKAGGSVEIIDL